MAYTYTNSGIVFNNLQDIGSQYPLKHRLNTFANIQKFVDKGQDAVVKPFVNAVEIDWNGAQLGE